MLRCDPTEEIAGSSRAQMGLILAVRPILVCCEITLLAPSEPLARILAAGALGNYQSSDAGAIDRFPISIPLGTNGQTVTVSPGEQQWSAGVHVIQSVYEGGRMRSALRSAKLTKEQALFEYQRVIADTLLE